VIGVKTAGAVGLAAVAVGAAAWWGRLGIDHLSTLGPTSCFAIGLFAGLATALVAVGWRPGAPSRLAVGLRGRRIVVEATVEVPRDIPSAAQRALLIAAFGCVGLAVFTNPGTARLVSIPSAIAEPSAGEYCRPPAVDEEQAEPTAAPTKPVEIPGCALVKRAVALGYAKSLGSCAPKDAPAAVKTAIAAQAPCELRQVDEPYLHYAWRRLSGAGGAIAGANPIDAIEESIAEKQIQLDHLDSLVSNQRHAIEGSPHAAHHVFVTLPDPHPGSLVGDLLDPPRCDGRYADLPLWPAATVSAGGLVDHVLGQLLFVARFGTTAACNDYVLHWDAGADACGALIRDPIGFLDGEEELDAVREVLDRRRRRSELRELDAALERKAPPPPPDASTIVSFACFVIDPAVARATATGRTIVLDGEPVSVRELRVPAVKTTGAGVLAVYDELATLLAGETYGPALVEPGLASADDPPGDQGALSHADFRLVRLDRLHDADPFAGHAWPLDRADLLEVYPLHRHLRSFVDAFRRRYRAQRGRL
jgi:hypothetical protein